jgi:Cu/Ag efflux protein CusF
METLKKRSLAFTLAIAAGAAAHAAGPAGTAADFGSPAARAAGRVIDVTPQTRYINVTQGEVVTLRMGEQTLNWQVGTYPNVNSFPLSRIAPEAAAGKVTVYVAADPAYQNG